jgi:hypothetical protein
MDLSQLGRHNRNPHLSYKIRRSKTSVLAPRRQETQGPIIRVLSRETDFDFALSAQLTLFGIDLLCAFAPLRLGPQGGISR